jgi:hypothetical protein
MHESIYCPLSLLLQSGCASHPVSVDRTVALARASLADEQRIAFPDMTEITRKDHVQSWMVIFENKNRDDGRWVMIDDHGEFVDAGRVYADH